MLWKMPFVFCVKSIPCNIFYFFLFFFGLCIKYHSVISIQPVFLLKVLIWLLNSFQASHILSHAAFLYAFSLGASF